MWQFPVFVRSKDSGDIESYKSIEDMCCHFERIDIENGEYEAWDRAGVPLNLSVKKSGEWLELEASGKPQPEKLARAIAQFAARQNIQPDASRLDAGGFPAALAQITSAIQAKRQTQSWWQRFKRHF
jgi:hypothetical protein